jgi:phospholipid/cholesterol/gamma-HCH transport system ATP-binding protein
MLYQGEILEMGTPEAIQRSTHPVVHQFITGSLEGPIQLNHRSTKRKFNAAFDI